MRLSDVGNQNVSANVSRLNQRRVLLSTHANPLTGAACHCGQQVHPVVKSSPSPRLCLHVRSLQHQVLEQCLKRRVTPSVLSSGCQES